MSQLQLSDDSLHRWQALTRAANALFAQGQLEDAISVYEQALETAEQLLAADISPDAAIAAYTVSRLNLAEAHDRADDPESAAEALIGIHLHLLKMALDPILSQAWRDAALHHSHRTHLELQHSFVLTSIPASPGCSRHPAHLLRI